VDSYRFSAKLDAQRRRLVFFPAINGKPAGYYPACDMCGGQFPHDAHEVWISRKDVMGNEDLIQKITTEPMNLSMLHHTPCHIPMAEPQRERLRMILVDYYGKDQIIAWINGLGLKCSQEYINMVLAVPDKKGH
jgi:hypothetical protein